MSDEKKTEYSVEWYNSTLNRLRKKLTYIQDDMDITSFAIRSLEHDLQKLEQEEGDLKE